MMKELRLLEHVRQHSHDGCRDGIRKLIKMLMQIELLPTLLSNNASRGVPTTLRSEILFHFYKSLGEMASVMDPCVCQVFQLLYPPTIEDSVSKQQIAAGEEWNILPILSHLQNYFNSEISKTEEWKNQSTEANGIGRVCAITYSLYFRFPFIIWEVNNNEEASPLKADTDCQAMTYYMQSVINNKLVILDNYPCIIVSLRGTIMSIHSVVLFDGDCPIGVDSLLYTLDLCQPMPKPLYNVAFLR
jgi:hypothetical protein